VNKQSGVPLPILLILSGLWVLWAFGWQTVFSRLWLELDGTVVASVDVPAKGAPRYGTYYTVRSADGHDTQYVAGATDASLDRSLPVGTKLRKRRWELGYSIDGRWASFPTYFYLPLLCAAVVALTAGILKWPAWRRSFVASR
jgi:hypothetical protein